MSLFGPLIERNGQTVNVSRESLIEEERQAEEEAVARYREHTPEPKRDPRHEAYLRIANMHATAAAHREELLHTLENSHVHKKDIVEEYFSDELTVLYTNVDEALDQLFDSLQPNLKKMPKKQFVDIPKPLQQFLPLAVVDDAQSTVWQKPNTVILFLSKLPETDQFRFECYVVRTEKSGGQVLEISQGRLIYAKHFTKEELQDFFSADGSFGNFSDEVLEAVYDFFAMAHH